MAAADRLHVLAIPYPAQGHINPMLDICSHLVPRGFIITFVNTDHTHTRILQSLPPHLLNDSFEQQGIHLVHIPGGLPPETHGYRHGSEAAVRASTLLEEPFERLLSKLQQEGPPVAIILSDALLGWTQRVATRFALPRVAFWPSSAATLSALFHFSELIAQGVTTLMPAGKHGDCGGEILIRDIPGLPPTSPDELPLAHRLEDGKVTEHTKLVADQFQLLLQSPAVLVNSMVALEGPVMAAISSKLAIWAIGPILRFEFFSSSDTHAKRVIRTSLFLEDGECLTWLDRQSPDSVLYISFGSVSVRSNEQLLELALGLEASEHPFLWAIRSYPEDADGSSELFSEFIERTRCKGVVVPWVPQLQVLSHPAVGGFMTHCGWNSITESMAMGVTMLCWADTGERKANQNVVVGEKGLGVAMRQGAVGEVMKRGEVERKVREFMEEHRKGAIRARAAQLKQSIAVGAESSKNFQELAAAMKKMAEKKPAAYRNQEQTAL